MAETTWFIRDRGIIRGPFSQDQLLQMHRRGQLARFHEVSHDRRNWVKAGSVLDPTVVSGSRSFEVGPTPMASPSSANSEVTSTAWPPVTDDSSLSADRPLAKASRLKLRWAAILAVPCVLAAAIMTFVTFFATHPGPFPISWGGATISSLANEEEIAGAVGLVVVGIEQARPDGTYNDKILSTGSCFAITEDGYLMTNRHVVNFVDQMKHAEGLEQRKLLYLKYQLEVNSGLKSQFDKIVEGFAPDKRNDAKEDLLKGVAGGWKFTKFDPQIWVFFKKKDGRPEKLKATLVYISDENDYDMAILKVDRTHRPYFGLATPESKVKQGAEVVAFGFPAVIGTPISVEELRAQEVRQSSSSRVEASFKERDFTCNRTDGKVNQSFREAGGRNWIFHDAKIYPGNSGGPLVTHEGRVIGINTQTFIAAEATSHAVAVGQMRPLIEDNAKGASFRD
jgi:S1-C subfamily serine protease